eukprot:350350-Chlamydomonas_euryale.AAC.1
MPLPPLQATLAAAFGPDAAAAAETYDGDTPQSERDDIRCRASVLITNPDMLHTSVMPYHCEGALKGRGDGC